jgi:hypothetical protein
MSHEAVAYLLVEQQEHERNCEPYEYGEELTLPWQSPPVATRAVEATDPGLRSTRTSVAALILKLTLDQVTA